MPEQRLKRSREEFEREHARDISQKLLNHGQSLREAGKASTEYFKAAATGCIPPEVYNQYRKTLRNLSSQAQ